MRNAYIALGRVLYWGIWPGSWLYLRGSRRTRLLLICGDEILVVSNWLGAGKWNLPGGGLHKGEDALLGLLREVMEETGIELRAESVKRLAVEPYSIHGFSYMCHYFTAVLEAKPETRNQPYEILEVAWTKRTSVSPDMHGPDIIRALELLDSYRSL